MYSYFLNSTISVPSKLLNKEYIRQIIITCTVSDPYNSYKRTVCCCSNLMEQSHVIWWTLPTVEEEIKSYGEIVKGMLILMNFTDFDCLLKAFGW